MRRRPCLCSSTLYIALLCVSASSGALFGQTVPPAVPPQPPPAAQQPANDQSARSADVPCVEPAPLLTLDDYTGPFKKTAGVIARKLELKTVSWPHHKPGATLCSLDAGNKFSLFVESTVEPVTFFVAGFWGGIAQAQNDDPSFGQGAQGFGKRYGAALADQASANFFGTFFYPAIFQEDPRYYRMAHGSKRRRLLHAVGHTFLARSDSSKLMFNFSEWMGTASAQVLSNAYHPGNRRGFAPAAQWVGINIALDMGVDVLREFWPEVAHKLRLPFISRLPEPANHNHKQLPN